MVLKLKIPHETLDIICRFWKYVHPDPGTDYFQRMTHSILVELKLKFDMKALRYSKSHTFSLKVHEQIALVHLFHRMTELFEENQNIYENACVQPLWSELHRLTITNPRELNKTEFITL
jgi:hypothetical protein